MVETQEAILKQLECARDHVAMATEMRFIPKKSTEPPSLPYAKLPSDGSMESMAEDILGPDEDGRPNPCGFGLVFLRDCLRELRAKLYELNGTAEAIERLSILVRASAFLIRSVVPQWTLPTTQRR